MKNDCSLILQVGPGLYSLKNKQNKETRKPSMNLITAKQILTSEKIRTGSFNRKAHDFSQRKHLWTHQKMRISLVLFMFLSVLAGLPVNGQGNLLITPRRVVFEGAKKIQELNLANIGLDTARYVLSMVEVRMKEDGSFENITEPDSGQNFASPYLRFFPRSVVLGPNESQLLKVQLTKTSQLEPGEYRSHVYFRAVREEKPLGEIEAVVDSNSISVSLIPVFGITIPVIIRVGELSYTVSMSDVSYHTIDTTSVVSMTFHRTGNMSAYGDVRVTYASADGKTVRVGQANGVAIYTPNSKRRFDIKLNNTQGIDFSKGKLHVEFISQSDVNPEIIAQSEIDLHDE
jgi:hypothetical protein